MSKPNFIHHDPSRPYPVPLTARISLDLLLLKGPVPAFSITDASVYGSAVKTLERFSLLDNVSDQNLLENVERASSFGAISQEDFIVSVNDGNVLGLFVQTQEGKSASLDLPFDTKGIQFENKLQGEQQAYQLVFTFVDFIKQVLESTQNSITVHPFVLDKITDDMSSFLATPDMDIVLSGINGLTLINPGTENEYYYAEFGSQIDIQTDVNNIFNGSITTVAVQKGENVIDSKTINPDGNLYFGNAANVFPTPLGLTSVFEYGGTQNIIDTLTLDAEDPQRNTQLQFDIRIDFPIDSIIHTEKIGNFANDTFTVIDIITTTGDITITIGDQTSTVAIDTAVQTDPGLIASHLASNWNIDGYTFTSFDGVITVTSSNVGESYNIPFEVTSPTNPTISGSLTGGSGEADSNQVPTSTQLDLAGEDIVEATYQFKNYLYIETDRTDLDPNNLEIEWKKDNGIDTYKTLTTTPTILELADTGLAKDLIRVPIPVFGEPFNVKVKDTTVNATGRELSSEAEWFTIYNWSDENLSNRKFTLDYFDISFTSTDEFNNRSFAIDYFEISFGQEQLASRDFQL